MNSSRGADNDVWWSMVLLKKFLSWTVLYWEIHSPLSWVSLAFPELRMSSVLYLVRINPCPTMLLQPSGPHLANQSFIKWITDPQKPQCSLPHHSLVLNFTRTWVKQNSSKMNVNWWTNALLFRDTRYWNQTFLHCFQQKTLEQQTKFLLLKFHDMNVNHRSPFTTPDWSMWCIHCLSIADEGIRQCLGIAYS